MNTYIMSTTFFVTLVIAGVLVHIIRHYALKHAVMDIPNERSSHETPTPRGGGLAIFGLCWGGMLLALILQPSDDLKAWIAFLVGTLVLGVVSILDDIFSLSNRIRFACHIFVAGCILVFCGHWSVVTFPFLGEIPLGWIGAGVAFIWIIGLLNVYNFMDGIDGIASVQAIGAGTTWALLGYIGGYMDITIFSLLIVASSLGFLWHNRPPAKIFMGDVGSTFLGVSFAALAILAAQRDPRLAVAGILAVWPFVFDGNLTLFRRAKNHENVFKAHRSHLYQRLTQSGWSHGQVTGLYAILSALGVVFALLFVRCELWGSIVAVVGPLTLGFGLFALTSNAEKKVRQASTESSERS
jgi:Fuc2NAc and GlcNAc transferase